MILDYEVLLLFPLIKPILRQINIPANPRKVWMINLGVYASMTFLHLIDSQLHAFRRTR
jgi:hypothetical protein